VENEIKHENDHAGVYLPPPIFVILVFLLSLLCQNIFPITKVLWQTSIPFLAGILCFVLGFIIAIPAIIKFRESKNTLITFKPTNSLQTSGIYKYSRNPMYLGLVIFYVGGSFFFGNLWSLLFIPLIVFTLTKFVIIKEEKYLQRKFGDSYNAYCKIVKRWI